MAKAPFNLKPVTPAGQVRPNRNGLRGDMAQNGPLKHPVLRASAFSGAVVGGSMTGVNASREFGRSEAHPPSQVTSSLRFEPVQSDQVSSVTKMHQEDVLQQPARYQVPITRGRIPKVTIASEESEIKSSRIHQRNYGTRNK